MLGKKGPSPDIRNGHRVGVTSKQAEFYAINYIEKPNQIARSKCRGEMILPHHRNPILGEKSARPDYSNWEFNAPSILEESDKFARQQMDEPAVPLIAQFQTQKKKFREEDEKARTLKDAMKTFYENQKLKHLSSHDTSRTSIAGEHLDESNPENTVGAKVTSRMNDGPVTNTYRGQESMGPMETDRTSMSTYRQDSTRKGKGNKHKKELIDFRVTTLKPLRKDHPEIISKWRAQRAAEFIKSTQGSQQMNDSTQYTGRSNFRKLDGNDNNNNQPLDSERMYQKLEKLNDELSKTNQQITRQQMKINLMDKKFGHNKINVNSSSLAMSNLGLTGLTNSARKYLILG